MMSIRRAAFATVAAVVMAVTGCDATVRTNIWPEGPGDVRALTEVRLSGPARDAFVNQPELLSRLDATVKKRSGSRVSREVTPTTLTFTTRLPVERLDDTVGLTGVSRIDVGDGGRGRLRVMVDLVPPRELISAISEVPDSDAIPIMLDNTAIEVAVQGGRILRVEGVREDSTTSMVREEGMVVVRRTLAASGTTSFEVEVDATKTAPWWVLVGAGVAVGAASLWWRSRRR